VIFHALNQVKLALLDIPVPFFLIQIHGIFYCVKIFVTKQSCIFRYALRLCLIIVTLEMKRITICLQWGLIFTGGFGKVAKITLGGRSPSSGGAYAVMKCLKTKSKLS